MATNIQEVLRLQEAREGTHLWKKWGPYLSERQWGTVREDYSENGDAWSYFTHDQARSRAYRWGEDGLAGISENNQLLCFALAFWNGSDSIIKERLFGLNNTEGNHGEDVKEYYFYLDNTPTHSYMKYLYKYPFAAFPYDDLVIANRKRSRAEKEYELIDTGVFDNNQYFDIFVEYAKASPEDILIQITAINRGQKEAVLHILPHLWFRNTWSWNHKGPRPSLREYTPNGGLSAISATHPDMGDYLLLCEGSPSLLFTENETNNKRIFNTENLSPYTKDGINNYVINNQNNSVNPDRSGTKAAAHYKLAIPPQGEKILRLRLTSNATSNSTALLETSFSEILASRVKDADIFYTSITPSPLSKDAALVMRQALAGMLWTKQFYYFDADKWLEEHGCEPFSRKERNVRNRQWFHMNNKDIISMPDKWEYPWYASWDLAFHSIALSMVDFDFAKEQLELMLRESYLHPSGQIPAYEWNFSDVNPPVHPWAVHYVYELERQLTGQADTDFLKRVFSKLLLNFSWWVNRKDRTGKNVFEGGFLGLDNIGVFDRSSPLPTGGYLEQADGTAWMCMYCQSLAEIAVELSGQDPSYTELVTKFVEHFLWIASAINMEGPEGLWDEEDGFYYDALRLPNGQSQKLKVRSIVGLLPLCATIVIEEHEREKIPEAVEKIRDRLKRFPELANHVHPFGPQNAGVANRGIIALLNKNKLERILKRMLDENEFLSPYGIRALSKYHAEHPFVFLVGQNEYRVSYLPAESDSGLFGGNSNWRGPIWLPMNILLIKSLMQFYLYYGDTFKVECPTGSGVFMNLFEVAQNIGRRIGNLFMLDETGHRPIYGDLKKFQSDPNWRDCLLFFEYFNGDNGTGLGASHQTGWTGIVAKIIQMFASLDPKAFLDYGKGGAVLFKK